MSSVTLSRHNDIPHIVVRGSFVFDINKEFRAVYRSLPAGTAVVVDLAATDYIDSAGLGMLIRLRDYAGGTDDAVTLHAANATVRKILEVANFARLFKID